MTVAPTPHLRRVGLAIVVGSLLAIGLATLLPEPPAKTGSHLCLVCGSLGVVNAVLNVFLFIPLGVGLALCGLDWKRAVGGACALSTAIEITQLLVIPGRYSTLGDVITNTLGGAIGFAIGVYFDGLLLPSPGTARRLSVGWAIIWLGVQIVSNYGFTTSFPTSQYYGQLARKLGSFDLFRGQVLSARIGGFPVPNTALGDSRSIRLDLMSGGTVQADVLPELPTTGVAPILRVVDNMSREIALIGQRDADMVFGVRTGASVLKLRAPIFILTHAFPTTRDDSTGVARPESVRGSYHAFHVVLAAETSARQRVIRIPVSASLAWTFWLPFEWFIGGSRSESMLSFLWLAALAMPLGYWAFPGYFGGGHPRMMVALREALFWLVVVVAGFVLTPRLYGMAFASFSDWLATFAGTAIGAALRSRSLSWKAIVRHV